MNSKEEKKRDQRLKSEKDAGGFRCLGCGEWVDFSNLIGTAHRNHCNKCFCSRHVDFKTSGDRLAECGSKMPAIGLTFKHEGTDKYGKIRQGELMFVHECSSCGKISINRIAGDDDEKRILELFEKSKNIIPEKKENLKKSGIKILGEEDREKLMRMVFGNT